MQQFIKNRMTQFHADFTHITDDLSQYCVLKGLTYEGGNTPDYTVPLLRLYYLLRFFPAYLAEYWLTYRHLFRQNFLETPLKVLSVGTGCGVDYYGLHFAANSVGACTPPIQLYTGVDLVDWGYYDTLGRDNVQFLTQGIQVWDCLDRQDYNVIIFPKSINEFPGAVFSKLLAIFRQTDFSQDRACLISSLMTADGGGASDMGRFSQIANIFSDKGFNLLDNTNMYTTCKHKRGLRSECIDCVYPDDIKDFVNSISQMCPTYIQNGNQSCHSNCIKLNRKPILMNTYVNYKVCRMEKAC